jgi:hypothetical protein
MDASDEDGSPLSFNSVGTMASSRRFPSSWRPPLGLAMISLECSPRRVSLVDDLLFLGGSEELDGASGEWWLAHAIRVPHTQHRRKGGATDTKTTWADLTRPTNLGPFWAGSGPSFSPRLIMTFCTWPPLFVSFLGRHPRDQDRGIFMHELPVFSSRFSGVLHSSTLVLATFGGKFAHGRSSLIDLQNVLQTSCIFPHLIRKFLQKYYAPKCTSNGELVISLACLVAG